MPGAGIARNDLGALVAEILASHITSEPRPVEKSMLKVLSPNRFKKNGFSDAILFSQLRIAALEALLAANCLKNVSWENLAH